MWYKEKSNTNLCHIKWVEITWIKKGCANKTISYISCMKAREHQVILDRYKYHTTVEHCTATTNSKVRNKLTSLHSA